MDTNIFNMHTLVKPLLTSLHPSPPVSGQNVPVMWLAKPKAKDKPWRHSWTDARRRPTRAVCQTTTAAPWPTARGTKAWSPPDPCDDALLLEPNRLMVGGRDGGKSVEVWGSEGKEKPVFWVEGCEYGNHSLSPWSNLSPIVAVFARRESHRGFSVVDWWQVQELH